MRSFPEFMCLNHLPLISVADGAQQHLTGMADQVYCPLPARSIPFKPPSQTVSMKHRSGSPSIPFCILLECPYKVLDNQIANFQLRLFFEIRTLLNTRKKIEP